MKILEFDAVNKSVHQAPRFFKLRLLASVLSFAGFWFCAGKARQMRLANAVAGGESGMLSISNAHSGVSAPLGGPNSLPHPGSPAAIPQAPIVAPSVMIDAGHGGADGGTPAGGMIEKEWTLKVALALEAELKSRGHIVEMMRSGDETVPLTDRPVKVNAAPRTAVISIHFNAGASDASGVETWYSWPKRPEIMEELETAMALTLGEELPDESGALASAIQSALHHATKARDRGIKNRRDLAITSRSFCPAVIVECGFLSNFEEGRLIRDESHRKKIVQGIAEGYETWLLNRRSPGSAGTLSIPSRSRAASEPDKAEDGDAEH
ncbi:MAG: N-acetylmuramoyl-L-alanine amidase [Verrucomicrobiaceae bacterium]|nr:MAG: N-acetylmuramoyl-L-alanine amidase [Verrucomicrobiaceae bacterium]